MCGKRVLWCLLLLLNCVFADIDTEYFFGNYLRGSKELNCDNEDVKFYCEMRCGDTHACLYGKCFCLPEEGNDDQKEFFQKANPNENSFLDFDDYVEVTPQVMRADTYPNRPALRHHIAHFCPNLEEARKCIRTCMAQGKPAFCGKDHVCYCGHKYDTPDEEEKIDVKDMYAQFKDLYQKYFGSPGYHSDETHEDY